MVKGRKCTRCDGKGFIAGFMHVNMGRCIACGGEGEVETDKATKAAKKAYQEGRRALGHAAFDAGHEAHSGLSLLEANEPERVAKAVSSFASGRTDVIDSLVAYYRSSC